MLMPRSESCFAVSNLLLPNSVMFASSGTLMALRNFSKSPSSASASGKIASAPQGRPKVAVQAFGSPRVRPRHDEKSIVAARTDGGANFFRHRLCRHERFAVEMAAAFGIHLIFQMTAAKSGVFECLNRACHVQRLAKTGICVNERRQIGRPRNRAAARCDFR